jgi:hypothetical protein
MSNLKGNSSTSATAPKEGATSDSGNESSSDSERKDAAPMSLSSDEVNYLIYRYLQVRQLDTSVYYYRIP